MKQTVAVGVIKETQKKVATAAAGGKKKKWFTYKFMVFVLKF
jgi:hypothetical protein